jgi:hypothetical protein
MSPQNKREGGPMRLTQIGGCQCGALRYEITQAPQSRLHLPLY